MILKQIIQIGTHEKYNFFFEYMMNELLSICFKMHRNKNLVKFWYCLTLNIYVKIENGSSDVKSSKNTLVFLQVVSIECKSGGLSVAIWSKYKVIYMQTSIDQTRPVSQLLLFSFSCSSPRHNWLTPTQQQLKQQHHIQSGTSNFRSTGHIQSLDFNLQRPFLLEKPWSTCCN